MSHRPGRCSDRLRDGVADLVPHALQRLRPIPLVRQPRSAHNSPGGARRNIAEHYDLSNALFTEFLDETMTYSSALFDEVPRAGPTLRTRSTARSTAARCGERRPGKPRLESAPAGVSSAIRAAARGAYVRSMTLSAEQQRTAQRRVAAAGLSGRVRIDLRDYRDVTAATTPWSRWR